MRRFLVFMLALYKKYISPFLPRSCKFSPTCSEYSAEAITRYGVFKGAVMSLWRILRCNPFSRGGFDPVIKNNKG
ncbi:MAG: membrane protein insertion efficiency factor YidD [Candidatus Omnitrophica bacterium]|nr:membrane protein insertion efficiency factor YidD [Candidatus Omnitrophota bacterium]